MLLCYHDHFMCYLYLRVNMLMKCFQFILIVVFGLAVGYAFAIQTYKPEVIRLLRLPSDSVCRNADISGQPAIQCCYFHIEPTYNPFKKD